MREKITSIASTITYLSDEDNWTPEMKFIAREFLVIGFCLGIVVTAAVIMFILSWSL